MKSQVAGKTKNGSTRARERVFVGLSGGVDSSVSAALLKEQGYEVVGVFIKTWQPNWIECTWKEERRDAMRVAAHLEISFVTLELEKEYKQGVADYMIAEYRAGRTPNPDVMCNKEVKFGAFYDWAMENGADYVATGHYAINKKQEEGRGGKGGKFQLAMGADKNKDQTYFLWTLKEEQLERILFPVGGLQKDEVRRLAKKFKLPTAEKKDSQGICFIGMVDMKDFLTHYIEPKQGDVLDISGKVIGTHDGAAFLTLGERHGFIITEKTPHDRPYFIVAKDIEKNTVTVKQKDDADAADASRSVIKNDSRTIHLSQCNWIAGLPEMGRPYVARTRYRQKLAPIIFKEIDVEAKTATVEYRVDPDIIAPGQSLVVYEGEICVGGGVIG